ncbi:MULTISPECIES: hypothetical protein [unclassified Isoptericola]|uniref:hypothetical protein n=1 Tax=unclassified Isoptericola TaxID=2623355 RepID=UPI0035F01743|nr:hypothetical protein [Isoptericola sp. QY 916]
MERDRAGAVRRRGREALASAVLEQNVADLKSLAAARGTRAREIVHRGLFTTAAPAS